MLPSAPQTEAQGRAISGAPLFPNKNPICTKIDTQIKVTSPLYGWCKGTKGTPRTFTGPRRFGTNVDAANPLEDFGAGQINPSIAAIGSNSVAVWHDATAFFAPCPASNHSEEYAALGFSNNGGMSFTDMGGLANSICAQFRFGAPVVTAYFAGTTPYFYLLAARLPNGGVGPSGLAISACHVTNSQLTCTAPVTKFTTACSGTPPICDAVDKPFVTVDPLHPTLFLGSTILNHTTGASSMFLEKCGLTNPASPSCSTSVHFAFNSACENTGGNVAVSRTGDVYVSFEYNWGSNLFGGSCGALPVREVIARFNALLGLQNQTSFVIDSLEKRSLLGYSGAMNDFPSLAVSDPAGAVSIVWNDTRFHPLGDILMQSFDLHNLALKSSTPIRINALTGGPHFMPSAVATGAGNLDIAFFGRTNATTTLTDLYGATNVSPLIRVPPLTNIKITTGSSDWAAGTSSFPGAVWGDYTSAYLSFNGYWITTWPDGRIMSIPQPFANYR